MEDGYDVTQAKFCASLLWFVCRISENGECDVPKEISSPLEITTTNELLVRPAVVDYLTNGAMYFKVAASIYERSFESFSELFHYLSKNDVYVMNENDEAVSHKDLLEQNPFKMNCHIYLMNAILQAYITQTASIHDFVNAMKKISNFNASKEMPLEVEDAVVLWFNKLNRSNTVCHLQKSELAKDTVTTKIRIRKDKVVEAKVFPPIKSISHGLHDGRSLLSILLYYYPKVLRIEEMNLSSVLTEREKLANIELFRSLCAEHICTSVFALRNDDFFYASDVLKLNFVALICEVLSCCQKLDTVQDVSIAEPKASHQPLLSKRSKKQFAKFEAAMVCNDQKRNEVQLDDFELKESHVIDATHSKNINNGAGPTTSLAWGDSKKQQKISANYKPDLSGQTRPIIKGVKPPDVVSTSFGNQGASNVLNHSSYPSHSSVTKLAWQNENHLHSSTQSFPATNSLSTTGTGYANLRSVYQLTVDPDLSSIEVSKEIEKSTVFEDETSLKHDNLIIVDEDEEDVLSTIMEATESDTFSTIPSHEISPPSSHSKRSEVNTADLSHDHDPDNTKFNDSKIKDEHIQYKEELPINFMNSDRHLKASYTVQESCTIEKAIANGLPVINSSDRNKEHHVGYIDLNTSQEVSGMESEQKTEVLDHFLLRNSAEVIDNFLQRTSVDMDVKEKLEYLDSSRNKPINDSPNYTGLTDINETCSIDSSQRNERHPNNNVSHSYDTNYRYPYNNDSLVYKQTQSLDIQKILQSSKETSFTKNHQAIDSEIITSKCSVSSISCSSKNESPPLYDKCAVQVPERTFCNNKSTLSQSSSVPCTNSYRPNIVPGKSLSQSFDSGYRRPKPQVPSSESGAGREQVKVSLSSKKEAYFNKVSYNHWPFTKSATDDAQNFPKTENIKDINGLNITVECLNILNRPVINDDVDDDKPTLLSSWVNESTSKPRLSLEEREERLRKIQERRLQTMGSGTTTTWSNLNRQQQQKNQEQINQINARNLYSTDGNCDLLSV